MDEQSNNTNAAFMEVTSRKVEGQDRKITVIEEKLNNIPEQTELIRKLIGTVERLREDVKNSHFPADSIREFSKQLAAGVTLLKRPVENKVLHHHHVPKIILITTGLFIILGLVSAGWYITSDKLLRYKDSDTKYRYLKLNGSKYLQQLLTITDSLCLADPGMRDSVIQSEEQIRNNLQMLQQAREMEEKAGELKKKAGDRK